jgi:hypothetical protein
VTAATGSGGRMATSRYTSRLPAAPKRGALAECQASKVTRDFLLSLYPRKQTFSDRTITSVFELPRD